MEYTIKQHVELTLTAKQIVTLWLALDLKKKDDIETTGEVFNSTRKLFDMINEISDNLK